MEKIEERGDSDGRDTAILSRFSNNSVLDICSNDEFILVIWLSRYYDAVKLCSGRNR